MLADTDAIRALGSANSTHAADLAAVAATLSAVPVTATLGPVGARFVSALAEAAADGARAVVALSDLLTESSTTAYAVATTYEDADVGAGGRIAEV